MSRAIKVPQVELRALARDIASAFAANSDLQNMLESCADSIQHHVASSSVKITFDGAHTDMQSIAAVNRGAKKAGHTHLVFPLTIGEKRIGLLEIWTASRLHEAAAQTLDLISDTIALGIEKQITIQQLEMKHASLDEFARATDDVFWIATADLSKHVYMSPSYEKMFGRSIDKALHTDGKDFIEAVIEEDRPKLLQHLKAEVQPEGAEVEYRVQLPDGTLRDIWVRSFPILDKNGNLLNRCGFAHDVTERKEAERRVREFYSMVSHELRTPLTSIRAALGLIEGGVTGIIPAETMELIAIARSESDRLVRLVNDILDLRKMEAGKLEFKQQVLDPGELINTSLSVMRGMAQEAHIQLSAQIDDNRQLVGDRDRVIQVLTNLLSNAIKFAANGTSVRIAVQPVNESFTRLSVTDEGPGIAGHLIPKLFGLFQQLDSSDARAKGGSGLGLAISKAIVERLHGQIGLDSTVGQGSTFWIELPVVQRQL